MGVIDRIANDATADVTVDEYHRYKVIVIVVVFLDFTRSKILRFEVRSLLIKHYEFIVIFFPLGIDEFLFFIF